MSEPEMSVTSAAGRVDGTDEIPGRTRVSPIKVELEQLRAALAALGVPEGLRTVAQVDTVEDYYAPTDADDDTVPADDDDQYTGLLALLQRMVTTLRAMHAIGVQSADDEAAERHVLGLDRAAALTADLHVLSAGPVDTLEELRSPEYARAQLAGNLSRSSEEARWLFETLTGMINYSRERSAHAGVAGRCDEQIPAPLFAARTTLNAVYTLLLIAYLEVARPDDVDVDDARALSEVLTRLRQVSKVLVQYGLNRGLLTMSTDAQGHKTYRIVEDIVAAAAGTDAGTDAAAGTATEAGTDAGGTDGSTGS